MTRTKRTIIFTHKAEYVNCGSTWRGKEGVVY